MVFDAHDKAFAFFGGACARGICANMKTAVDTIFVGKDRAHNRRLQQMRRHHLVDPVACTPVSGWEKAPLCAGNAICKVLIDQPADGAHPSQRHLSTICKCSILLDGKTARQGEAPPPGRWALGLPFWVRVFCVDSVGVWLECLISGACVIAVPVKKIVTRDITWEEIP